MQKILSIAIFILLSANYCFANPDSLTIKIQSQYETALKDVKLIVLNSTVEYSTNQLGFVTIAATTKDSIKILDEYFEQSTVSLEQINAEKILTINKNFHWKDLLTPMFYIINGLWLILLIIFAETGLFVGFFLPGDSLLFVAGIYNRELIETIFPFISNEYLQLLLLGTLISIAGIIGNAIGYWFGRKVGPAMYHWKDNLLFKKHYLEQAHDFYEKHGGGAIIIARFIPIIRTFAPIVAGIVQMDKKKFTFYNIIGCIAWVFSMLIAGHFLQKWILSQFGFDLKSHLEIIVIGIVLVTTAPVIIKLATGKKKK
jgi:membrane-associated protein